MTTVAFERLIDQIDLFIRKYYKNQMIRGIIWFASIFLLTFLFTTILEYFGRFGTAVRAVLFFSFVFINLFVLIQFIAIPLFKLYSFGRRIDRYQASEIIGRFFPNISDRLLNTLQLHDDLNHHLGNLELLRASVAQRSESLSVVSFSDAVNIRENIKYLKWFFPVFLLFLLIAVIFPSLFREGSKRVVNYSTVYVPDAPFSFHLQNFKKEITEGDDLSINLKLLGDDIPNKVYLVSSQGKQLMTISGRNSFVAIIPKVQESGSFYFEANEFFSKEYHYSVFGLPVLGKFQAEIIYPKYLGRSNEIVNNAGDMTVMEGTKIIWNVLTKNTSSVDVTVGDSNFNYVNYGHNNAFRFEKTVRSSVPISLFMKGNRENIFDSVEFEVHVLKDAYPTIQVKEIKDSLSESLRFFSGFVSDDYGLTSLDFVYSILSKDGNKRTETISVRSVSGLEAPFEFGVDFMREKIQLEDKIEYYFVVTDNDGVNGRKSTRSQIFVYQLPTLEELNNKREEIQELGKQELSNLLIKSQQLQKDIDRLQKELLNSKSNDWKQKNQLNQLKNQHSELIKSLQQVQKQLQESSQEKFQLSEQDEEFLEKQKMIEDLLEQLMDDELMKLMDELEKMLEQNLRDQQQNVLDDMKMSSDDINKRLDRTLEMLKKMQVDEKIDAIEESLKKLANEQIKLKEDIESKSISKDESIDKQKDINDKFDQLKDDLKKLDELNKELHRPINLPSTSEQEKNIDNELNNASDNLSKGKDGKAGKNQQSASEQMEQLADQLDMAQQQSNQEQQSEDMNLLRDILESLVTLSLDQEKVMNNFKRINRNDPNYRTFGRVQRTIVDNTLPVSDSLYELAKRQPMLSKFVDTELKTIKINQSKALEEIGERRTDRVMSHQQLAMTSYNNLALMLNESLEQMQAMMQSMMEGSGSCSKPGKGKPKSGDSESMDNMKDMLKKQLEQMKKGMNPNGQQPGESQGKQGNKKGQGQMNLGNKEIAKMATEQSIIRQRLNELKNKLNKQGKGEGNKLNPLLKELEKQQEDLINKRLSKDMVRRQQDILTRLLESEKALKERDWDDKRESKEGKNKDSNLIRFDEYNKEKMKQIELLRTVDPVYNKYYKDKATQYFNSIN